MKPFVTYAICAALLSFTVLASAQEQASPGAQTAPSSDQSTPTVQPQTEPAPAAPQTPAQPSPQVQPPPQPSPPASLTSEPPKPVMKKNRAKTIKPRDPSRKVVVRNGGAKEDSAQLTPGMSKEQELHNRETTSHLLATTDANLKNIAGRQLTPAQQGLLDQIHSYVRQSREASDSGDLARAHTLAYKAHLLSDELMRK